MIGMSQREENLNLDKKKDESDLKKSSQPFKNIKNIY